MRRWTAAMEDFVRANAGHTHDQELARLLTTATGGRVTPRAVRHVRERLGVEGRQLKRGRRPKGG